MFYLLGLFSLVPESGKQPSTRLEQCARKEMDGVPGWRAQSWEEVVWFMRPGRKDLTQEVAFKSDLRDEQKPLGQGSSAEGTARAKA